MRAWARVWTSHGTVAARAAGGALGAAEMQGLAAALASHRARAQHVGATERVLDELVGPVAAGQSEPPPAQQWREKNEAENQTGQQQQSTHETIPGRGVSRASGENRGPGRAARIRSTAEPRAPGRRRCQSRRRA